MKIVCGDKFVSVNENVYSFSYDMTNSPSGWRWVFIAELIQWAVENSVKYTLNGKA